MLSRVNADGDTIGLYLKQSGDKEGVGIALVSHVGRSNEIECVATLTSGDVASLVFRLQALMTACGAMHIAYRSTPVRGNCFQLEASEGPVLDYKICVGDQSAYVDAPTLWALKVGLEHILADIMRIR